jgi:hypothetical protein
MTLTKQNAEFLARARERGNRYLGVKDAVMGVEGSSWPEPDS